MNSTTLNIKIEPSLKAEAQKTADELGLSLSAVIKALLTQFARTKQLSVSVDERPEIPNARTAKALQEAMEDIKAGRVMSFKSNEEAVAYVRSLKNDKKHQHTAR